MLIPGLMLAFSLGWHPKNLTRTNIFPSVGRVQTIEDGDTFILANGMSVRLIGVNAPERGVSGFDQAKKFLNEEIGRKTIYLEYDRYQDDKYGRILAWVWIDCETTPVFLPADYMHLSGNQSRPGLLDNPKGCAKGKLVNEDLVRSGNAVPVSYEDRGELKYEARLRQGFGG